MMDMLNSLFDPYDRKARLAPALLCALPLFASLLLLVPEVGAIWGRGWRTRSVLRRSEIPYPSRSGSGKGPGTDAVRVLGRGTFSGHAASFRYTAQRARQRTAIEHSFK